jgi:hypothetical protein
MTIDALMLMSSLISGLALLNLPSRVSEGSETAILTLTDTADYDLGRPGTKTATVEIADNEGLTITPINAVQLEGNTGYKNFTFNVSRNININEFALVNYTVSGSRDSSISSPVNGKGINPATAGE